MFLNPPLILIASAVLPAVVLLVKVYKADKLDKEPPSLLVSLVLYGILATGLAIAVERIGSTVLAHYFQEGSLYYNLILYFGIVAFGEEGAKYILLKKRTWNSVCFNCQFDGVVYAVYVSLGFALWENIGYVTMYGLGTAMVRAVTAVPGHACFGVFMGTWYGIAKRYEGSRQYRMSRFCRTLSLLLPAITHGFYDFAATDEKLHKFFAIFILVMFLIAYRLVKHISENDRYIAQSYFPYL